MNARKSLAMRRAVPIHAYVGGNGGGKSLAMVHDTLPSLAAGRPVLSTVRLVDWTDPEGPEHPLYQCLSRLVQLLDAEHCDVLLDEVTGVASSRGAMQMPVQLQNMLVQLRRRDVVVRYTTPSYARADVIVREVTQAVTWCKGMLRVVTPEHSWPQARLFLWRTYDAFQFDEFSQHKRESIRPVCTQFFWRPGKAAESAYDTLEAVSVLDHVTEMGHCLVCGGSRPRPKCRCQPAALPVLDQPRGSRPQDAPRAAEDGHVPDREPVRVSLSRV